MTNKKNAKIDQKFFCELCDFSCSKRSNFEKHISTPKHQKRLNPNKKMPKNATPFMCSCGKSYKHLSSLSSHKKKCLYDEEDKIETDNNEIDTINANDPNYKEMFVAMMNENRELRKTLQDVIPKIGNNNNTIKNEINMNIFLNDKCKDALNIMDFINSLKLKLEDLEHTAKVGYVDGISRVLIKGLQNLDIYKRPIHCTNTPQEVLYVKDENNWNEDPNNVKIKSAISKISKTNAELLPEWLEKNQEYLNNKNHDDQLYWKIIDNTVVNNEEDKINKIIKNVAKEVIIEEDSEESNDIE